MHHDSKYVHFPLSNVGDIVWDELVPVSTLGDSVKSATHVCLEYEGTKPDFLVGYTEMDYGTAKSFFNDAANGYRVDVE